jgi:hypothetical protein
MATKTRTTQPTTASEMIAKMMGTAARLRGDGNEEQMQALPNRGRAAARSIHD